MCYIYYYLSFQFVPGEWPDVYQPTPFIKQSCRLSGRRSYIYQDIAWCRRLSPISYTPHFKKKKKMSLEVNMFLLAGRHFRNCTHRCCRQGRPWAWRLLATVTIPVPAAQERQYDNRRRDISQKGGRNVDVEQAFSRATFVAKRTVLVLFFTT